MKTKRKYGFKKYIQKLENITPKVTYCKMEPIEVWSWEALENYRNTPNLAIDSFLWRATPQGADYWSKLHNNDFYIDHLPDEAIRFFEYLLQYKGNKSDKVPLDKWIIKTEED